MAGNKRLTRPAGRKGSEARGQETGDEGSASCSLSQGKNYRRPAGRKGSGARGQEAGDEGSASYSLSQDKNYKRIMAKIKRTLRSAAGAWWVLLLIVGYSAFAWRFLGTSCVLASTTGLPCPGCGGTRALVALLGGDIKGSLRFHPLLIPALMFVCVYIAFWLVRENMPRFMERVLIILTVALIGLYAVRMILLFPHGAPLAYNNDAILPRIVRLFSVLW